MIHTLILAIMLGAVSPAPPLPANCTTAIAFVGTSCTPAQSGKHPAILLLGGSEGGDRMSNSATRFASAGYVAASVAYFGLPGLPQSLENIPVETVGKALDAIRRRLDVDPNRIALFGISKGGELALLAASIYPQFRAVVAAVPSPFAWQGIAQGPQATAQSSWTLNGRPVPFVPYGAAMGQGFANAYQNHAPLDLRAGYDASMQQNASAISAAMFHLENVRGPIFLIAASDDHIWDSVAQVQIGMDYLRAHHHPYDDVDRSFAGAGHVFLFATPQHPLTESSMGPFTLLLGGTPAANVQASGDAWPQIMRFLDSALGASNTP